MRIRLSLAIAAVLLLSTVPVTAQEYRAYWVETFNSQLATSAEVDRVIQNCVDGNCNAIFAQVRRRGDSWYLDTLEPLGAPISPTFDPLATLITRAHARGIEVHAFVIIGTIHNAAALTPIPARLANSKFYSNIWDPATNAVIPPTDPRQWATRSLPHNAAGTTFNGQRQGAEWYIDLGHPGAVQHTINVLTHLAERYEVDGIHLDRIRYPEAPINRLTGQPLTINIGYNETSVQRFKASHGSSASYYDAAELGQTISTNPVATVGAGDVGYPKTGDPLWNQWRRDQVTNFVRRLYLRLSEVRPNLKLSAALICFWTGPVGSGGWERTEAYYRVFQDWKLWAEEGILDVLMPMAYKREHTASERAQFDDWMAFTKSLAAATGRHGVIGHGAYINSIEGTLLQLRRAALPPTHGSVIYALGNTLPGNITQNSTNAAVPNNSVSYPTPGVSTPRRPNSEFFAAVKTGLTIAPYEPTSLTPVWSTFVPVPAATWKQTLGHIAGFAVGAAGPLDAANVAIEPIAGGAPVRRSTTSYDGFYGGAGLPPGQYRVEVRLGSESLWALPFVTAASVTHVNPVPDTVAPSISIAWPLDGARFVYSEVVPAESFQCSDALSGIATCTGSPFGTNVVGSQLFTVSSTDRAGNPAAASVSYEVVRASTALSVTYAEDRNRMTLIATVVALAPATAVPTGTVEFVDKNHGSLGVATLVDGVAQLEVQRRALHLTVTYTQTANFAAASVEDVHVVPSNQ